MTNPQDLQKNLTSEGSDWAMEAQQPIPLVEALVRARASTAELTGLPIDGIAASELSSSGEWRVTVEVVEGAARIGENDLLAAYQVDIGHDGALVGYRRIRRYRREEGNLDQ